MYASTILGRQRYVVIFWSVGLILLLMALFFVCGFSRTIMDVYAFLFDGVILIVCE
jgi:hypothetical protein